MSLEAVDGPHWSDGQPGRAAGRFPLAVESFAMARVAELLPGVTTVTPHAKYYALHAWVAGEVARGAEPDVWDFLRRCEVVVGAASAIHLGKDPDAHRGLASAHGQDAIAGAMQRDGLLPLADLAAQEVYAQAKRGFLGPYLGSERGLGLVTDYDGGLQPGALLSLDGMPPAAFAQLRDLVHRDELDLDRLDDRTDLCVCGDNAPERQWLTGVLFPATCEPASPADKRKQTAKMLLRLVDLYEPDDVSRGLDRHLVSDRRVRDDTLLGGLEVVPAWRGVVLRSWFAWAWRDLWAWLVNDALASAMPTRDLSQTVAPLLPNMSTSAFLSDLPPPMLEAQPADAEFHDEVMAFSGGGRYVARLILGAARVGELAPEEAAYFENTPLERSNRELTPTWTRQFFDERASMPIRDVAIELVDIVIRRAQRVASAKSTFRAGRLVVPSRVALRDGVIFRDSCEGGGPVSLRWNQLAQILCGLGYLERADSHWSLADGMTLE